MSQSGDQILLTPQQALLLREKYIQPLQSPSSIQPSTTDLLANIIMRLLVIQSPVPNRRVIFTAQKTVQTSGLPQQLPNIPIPDGFSLVIKAKKANTNNVTVGGDGGSAYNKGGAFYSLAPNEQISYNVNNANVIWIDVVTSGEGVELTVEV